MKATLYRTGEDVPGEPLDDVHIEATEDGYVNLWLGRFYLELPPASVEQSRDDFAEIRP